eukprot:TRINITY_DN17712_c0_g1_i2.p1 TRINITY_DN17712_c0_g1~~TRINITY_DN17712_c0_g1_i2.p1  ORF type:complete len:126 (-),score=8.30 TRINITY_DN17712_c0_g1_i2:113-490(-)
MTMDEHGFFSTTDYNITLRLEDAISELTTVLSSETLIAMNGPTQTVRHDFAKRSTIGVASRELAGTETPGLGGPAILWSLLHRPPSVVGTRWRCLLYTSDAADEEDSVDLGGRRIIKKKKKIKYH